MKRETGYYFIKVKGCDDWLIAKYEQYGVPGSLRFVWCFLEYPNQNTFSLFYEEDDVVEVFEKRILTPEEQKGNNGMRFDLEIVAHSESEVTYSVSHCSISKSERQ